MTEMTNSNLNSTLTDSSGVDYKKDVLIKITKQMPWQEIDILVWQYIKDHTTPYLQRHNIPSTSIETRDLYKLLDLFTSEDELLEINNSGIAADRNRLTVRLMMSLLFLEFEYHKSIQETFQEWSQNMYYQQFSGIESFEIGRQACHPIQLNKFMSLLLPAVLTELKTLMSLYSIEIMNEWCEWDPI